MDALPEPPPSYEEVITRKLVGCGLSEHGLSVSYHDDLQSYTIVVGPSAKGTAAKFACIRDAAAGAIVIFADPELDSQYDAFVEELHRPETIAEAEAALSALGLLEGLPRRTDFASDAPFAEALEMHCGLQKGEAIRPFGDMFAVEPPSGSRKASPTAMERYFCLLSAMRLAGARGELKFGFVGKEAATVPD
ncbi:hypothetical protein [Rhizorhabdus sp. FW153]|uniref:hypothetical protein n=1 Tax=Rhizorhabdus sp. FW153 TaxID=3400216 RepID=UPI003CF4BEC4